MPVSPSSQPTIALDSAHAVLAECRRRGVELQPTDTGVKCRASRGVIDTQLHAAITAHRGELRTMLVLVTGELAQPSPTPRRDPPPTRLPDWPAGVCAAADFALLLTVDDLPPAPFTFGRGVTVVDAEKFLTSIQADVRRGRLGPRAKPAVLHAELLRLRDLLTETIPDQQSVD
jgi:hypothetical protein